MSKAYTQVGAAFRSWIGRLFGFEKEIENLKAKIEELRWDTAFDMWTRAALLQICMIMPRGERAVAFLDFNDIHALNHEVGYSEVDRRIRETFSIQFRSSDLVARWYSGDEIVIVFDADMSGAQEKIRELEIQADRVGVGFVCQVGNWNVGSENLVEVIDQLSDNNRTIQRNRKRGNHAIKARR